MLFSRKARRCAWQKKLEKWFFFKPFFPFLLALTKRYKDPHLIWNLMWHPQKQKKKTGQEPQPAPVCREDSLTPGRSHEPVNARFCSTRSAWQMMTIFRLKKKGSLEFTMTHLVVLSQPPFIKLQSRHVCSCIGCARGEWRCMFQGLNLVFKVISVESNKCSCLKDSRKKIGLKNVKEFNRFHMFVNNKGSFRHKRYKL